MENTPLIDFLSKYSETKTALLCREGLGENIKIHAISNIFILQKIQGIMTSIKDIYDKYAPNKQTLVVNGGNYSFSSSEFIDTIEKSLDLFDEIIILPSSLDESYPPVQEFISTLNKKITLFCREKQSYEYAKKNAPKESKIFLDQDLGFFFDYTPWRKKNGEGTIYSFRNDLERAGVKKNFSFKNQNLEEKNQPNCFEMLEKVSSCQEIHTDQLHAAIASAIIGKKVFLYPSRSEKNQRVYEHSLSKYTNVTMMQRKDYFELTQQEDPQNKPKNPIESYVDKIFVINLAWRPEKWVNVAEQLLNIGILNFERSPGIVPDLEKIPLNYYNKFTILEPCLSKEQVIRGAMGCKLAHLRIIKDAKQKNYSKVLIIEDDIIVHPQSNEIFSKALENIDKTGWDLFYLGGIYADGIIFEDKTTTTQKEIAPHIMHLKWAMTTCAYIIHKKLFDTVIQNLLPSGKEIDIFYVELQSKRDKYFFAGINPPIMEHLPHKLGAGPSDIRGVEDIFADNNFLDSSKKFYLVNEILQELADK